MGRDYKLVHSCIRVLDLEKSIAFYKDALNFEIARIKDFPEYKFTLVYMKGAGSDFEIELTYNYDQAEPYQLGTGYSHFAVVVDDLEASHREHKDKGYKVTETKKLNIDDSGRGGFYFLTDPDGYKIEVIQRSGVFK